MEHIDLGTRNANIKSMYNDLKDGYTISLGILELWIYTCERWGSPSYGKDYIRFYGFGSWATRVNFRDFSAQIRNVKGSLAYDREF